MSTSAEPVDTLLSELLAATHDIIRRHKVTYAEYDVLKSWLIQATRPAVTPWPRTTCEPNSAGSARRRSSSAVHDVAPLSHAMELAAGVPCATLTVIDAGHLAVEQPQAVREALLAHLGAVAHQRAPMAALSGAVQRGLHGMGDLVRCALSSSDPGER
ncbi:hypothetical protein [Streptomyces mirabilis]|uniref:hypothetical protein n=1 Tax=Streptomyces mirabilis TaxID=68239 RepID=UPI0036547439